MEFTYERTKIKAIFLITDERSPNVLGRNILGKLQLNWKIYLIRLQLLKLVLLLIMKH